MGNLLKIEWSYDWKNIKKITKMLLYATNNIVVSFSKLNFSTDKNHTSLVLREHVSCSTKISKRQSFTFNLSPKRIKSIFYFSAFLSSDSPRTATVYESCSDIGNYFHQERKRTLTIISANYLLRALRLRVHPPFLYE